MPSNNYNVCHYITQRVIYFILIRLARTIVTQQPDDLTLLDREADIIGGDELAVGAFELVNLDHDDSLELKWLSCCSGSSVAGSRAEDLRYLADVARKRTIFPSTVVSGSDLTTGAKG